MTHSLNKGKAGERELANILKTYGYDTRRSQQFSGLGDSSADVIGLPNIHIESKRTEVGHGKTYEWLDQAQRDSKGTSNIPCVFHRKNRKEWLVTLTLEDFMRMYQNKND